jgi:hypothetical protein
MAGIIVGTNNANAIATVVAARTLPRLKSNTVAYACSDPSYASEIARFGDTVNVPIPAEFTTNLIADGGTINRQNPSLGNAALVLDTHRELSFEHTDINKAFATPDLQNTSLGQAVANFCEDVDEDLLGIYSTLIAGTPGVGTYNTSLTEAVVDSAETALFDERIPAEIEKHLIVTGTGYSSIRMIPRFSEHDLDKGAAGSTSAKLKGKIKDFNVYRAQKVNVTSSTNRHGIAMCPTALLTAVRPLGVQAKDGTVQVEVNEDNLSIRLTMSYHHEVLGELSTLDLLYGYIAGRTNHGLEVKH